MNEIISQFEAYLLSEKRVSKNTFVAYANDIEQFAIFLRENEKLLKNVNNKDLKAFLRHLKVKEGIGARSLSRKISTLKTFFLYLHERHGYINFASDLVFPKLEKRLPEYLSEQEVEKLFEFTAKDASDQGKRNHVMLVLLYSTGMRVTELVKLTLGDIQFDVGVVTVSGKGGKERLIPLTQPVLVLLRDYLQVIHPRLINKKSGNKVNDFLFPVCYGNSIKHISRQAFWAILKRVAVPILSKKSISPHKFRHSLATHMLKRGVDLRSLQMLLGHENLSTVEIYTHVDLGYARKVYDKKHPRS